MKKSRIPRYAEIKRTRIKARNLKRAAANLERAHGSQERREWTKARPCYICARTPCDAAHVKNGGGSRKADVEWTVPLCSDAPGYLGHHAEYDGRKFAGGKKTFEAKYGISMDLAAAATEQAWQRTLTLNGETD